MYIRKEFLFMRQIVYKEKRNTTMVVFILLFISSISAIIFVEAVVDNTYIEEPEVIEIPVDVEFLGLDDITMYVGETYYFKENVIVLINGAKAENVDLLVYNADGIDISSIPTVVLDVAGVYQYTYVYIDESGNRFEKVRTVTCKIPEVKVEVQELAIDIISLRYTITNESASRLQLYMEDWSIFDPNHRELKKTLDSNETWESEFVFTLIPVYQDDSGIPEINDLEVDIENPNALDVYFKDDTIGFAPTFYFSKDNVFLEGFHLSEPILYDTTELYAQRGLLSQNLIKEVVFTNRSAKVGDTITLYTIIQNTNQMDKKAYIEDWGYFPPYARQPLGTIPANSKVIFELEIEVSPTMLDSDGRIAISYPSIHYFGISTPQLFVQQSTLQFKGIVEARYIDENGMELAPSDIRTGQFGESYQTKERELDGYVLKKRPENEKDVFTEQKITVIYEYQKAVVAANEDTDELDDTYKNSEIKDEKINIQQSNPPKTGDLNCTILNKVAIMLSIILFAYFCSSKSTITDDV